MRTRARLRMRQNELDQFGIPLEEDMAAYREEDTGLPMIVVILSKGGAKHGPRVKLQQDHSKNLNKDNLVSVSISSSPEVVAGKWKLSSSDFQLASDFITAHRKVLLAYWDYKLLTRDLEQKLFRK